MIIFQTCVSSSLKSGIQKEIYKFFENEQNFWKNDVGVCKLWIWYWREYMICTPASQYYTTEVKARALFCFHICSSHQVLPALVICLQALRRYFILGGTRNQSISNIICWVAWTIVTPSNGPIFQQFAKFLSQLFSLFLLFYIFHS